MAAGMLSGQLPLAAAADAVVRDTFPDLARLAHGAATALGHRCHPIRGGRHRQRAYAVSEQSLGPAWRGPAPRSIASEMPWNEAPQTQAPRVITPRTAQIPAAAEKKSDGAWTDGDLFPMRWALAGYAGLGTEGGIEDLPLFDAQFNAAYIVAIEPSLQILNLYDWISVEAAVNLAQYFNRQTNTEANAFLIFRWLKFPWDRWLDTSFTVGEGISYATPVGSVEKRRSPEVTSNFLNYLMFELEVAPPDAEHWSGFMRIHHRSGVFSLYNDVSNGSNFLVWGLRYRF